MKLEYNELGTWWASDNESADFRDCLGPMKDRNSAIREFVKKYGEDNAFYVGQRIEQSFKIDGHKMCDMMSEALHKQGWSEETPLDTLKENEKYLNDFEDEMNNTMTKALARVQESNKTTSIEMQKVYPRQIKQFSS
jgi:hypothetical protein